MKKLALASVLALASLSAQAAGIAGLNSTGSGFAAGVQDTHYALSSSTTEVGPYGYVASNNSFPIGPWVSNTATSAWLTPAASQSQSFDPSTNGIYTWTTTFDLTGFNAKTASFSGQFAADNSAVAYLNGNIIVTSNGYSSWSALTATSNDFKSGVNTLSFVVTNLALNGGNPTGLQVNFTASNVSAVPEPGTYAMLITGLGLMGFMLRSKKSA